MSILGLLGVAFIVLKLCGVIAWAWWVVLMPLYIIPVVAIIVVFVAVVSGARRSGG